MIIDQRRAEEKRGHPRRRGEERRGGTTNVGADFWAPQGDIEPTFGDMRIGHRICGCKLTEADVGSIEDKTHGLS